MDINDILKMFGQISAQRAGGNRPTKPIGSHLPPNRQQQAWEQRLDNIIKTHLAEYDARSLAGSANSPTDSALAPGSPTGIQPTPAQSLRALDDDLAAIVSASTQRPRSKRPQPQSGPFPTSIVDTWKTAHAANPEEPKLDETLRAITLNQDKVSAGEPVPPSPTTSMPGPIRLPSQEPSEPSEPQPAQTGKPAQYQVSKTSSAVDMLQLGLDTAGIFDPTPISDGINAGISLGRAFITDPERRSEHLQNAAISGVSMVPYVGDFAKLAKVPRAAKTVSRTGEIIKGGEAAADGVTNAQKRAARKRYRNNAKNILGSDDQKSPAVQPGGGSSQPPSDPPNNTSTAPGADDEPRRVNPSPGSKQPSLEEQRQQEKGIQEHDKFSDKLRASTEKLADWTGTLGKWILKGVAFVESLSLLNTGVLALNRDLENYNGKIAGAYAKSDVADIKRNIDKGENLENPISDLNEAQSELKDNLDSVITPIQGSLTQALALLTELVNLVTSIARPVIAIIGVLFEFMEKILAFITLAIKTCNAILAYLPFLANLEEEKEKSDASTPWRRFFHDTSDGKLDGKRPDFHGGKVVSKQILNDKDHKDVFGS